MRIDWVTLVAQLVNFAILVALLHRLLYRRVLAMVDLRERELAERHDAAVRRTREAEELARALKEERRALRDQERALLVSAEHEAAEHRETLLREAQQAADEARARWGRSLERQRAAFLSDLRRHTGAAIFATLRQMLADLADESVEVAMATVLRRRMSELTPDERRAFVASARREGAVAIRSAYPLPEPVRESLAGDVRALTGDLTVRMEVVSDLLCGIEFAAGDRRVSWTMDAYLRPLEEQVDEFVQREARASIAVAPGEVEDRDKDREQATQRRVGGDVPSASTVAEVEGA